MHRLFIALNLPPTICNRLTNLCQGVSGAKWADSSNFHLTLRFIGDVDDILLREVEYALAEITAPSFDLALKGVGYFPPRGPAKVLWAGVETAPALFQLREQIVKALNKLDFKPERRKFSPHITLARFMRGVPETRVTNFLSDHALFYTEPFLISEFHLYSSLLRPEGALHRIEVSYPLSCGMSDWGEFCSRETNT